VVFYAGIRFFYNQDFFARLARDGDVDPSGTTARSADNTSRRAHEHEHDHAGEYADHASGTAARHCAIESAVDTYGDANQREDDACSLRRRER
jgi:hypothetical protein